MSANERRAEIIKILTGRHKEQVKNLAFQLGVSIRTIKNDILILTSEHPIETIQGRGGGVRLMKGYNTYRNDITQQQQNLLMSLIPKVDKQNANLLKELLVAHGSVRLKTALEGG